MKSKTSLRAFPSASQRREFLEKELGIKLDKISEFNFTEEDVLGRNIENLIGAAQIPLGVAGPLLIRLKGAKARLTGKNYFIPLATTEGALVASVSRGCKAVTAAGGVTVLVLNTGITRGPVFKTAGIEHGLKVKNWIENHPDHLSAVTQKTSSHLKLLQVDSFMAGKNLFVRLFFDTADAMGMNMATIAAEKAVELIEEKTKAKCVSLAGNFDVDKKGSWLNFISGRGKRVWAEVVLPEKVVKKILKTTSQALAEIVYRKCLLGSVMSGSLGYNGHFANIIAAVFAATGQDLAHTVEGSLGVTTAEVLEGGDLYFSVYLPALVAGTVGGGTHLPAQKQALEIMQTFSVLEYAQVLGAAVLAGELSLLASLAEGSLVKAHQQLGRKGR